MRRIPLASMINGGLQSPPLGALVVVPPGLGRAVAVGEAVGAAADALLEGTGSVAAVAETSGTGSRLGAGALEAGAGSP
jgi:hypothetical protein